MVDFWSGAWQGFCTGCGVIFAAKLMNYIDSHPLVGRMKKSMDIISWRKN